MVGYRDGKPYGKPYSSSGPVHFPAGKFQVLLGLRHSPAGGNRLLKGVIQAAQLYDRALTPEEITNSVAAGPAKWSEGQLLAAMTSDERREHDQLAAEAADLKRRRDELQPVSAYVATPRPPGVSHVLLRGNPGRQGKIVSAGGVAAVAGLSADFCLPADASDAARRTKLADWVTHPDNPLFARVIANRIWHYHFGVGLVETPNDFGFNGGRPSHPELIDYLVFNLRVADFRLKPLHRLIVTSAAYRQSSRYNDQAAAVDAGNRLLWRKNPLRQEAEELRDSMLAVSGQLNLQLGGPGFRDFNTFTHNSQFYEMQDPVGPEFNRRTLYRTWIRSGRVGLLDVFDCPDPSTKTPRRAVTVTPLQALTLMNNSFTLRMAEHWASRLVAEAGNDRVKQVRRAWQLAYSRAPDEAELTSAATFVKDHGLAELCRVVFNSNEFLYID